jgi:mRNA interferase MazF
MQLDKPSPDPNGDCSRVTLVGRLGEPRGSEPALTRPGLVISADAYNESRIATVVVIVLTSNVRLGRAPGNVTVPQGIGGLPKTSVVNVSQIATVDKANLIEQIGQLPEPFLSDVGRGLRRSLVL